MTAKKNTDVAEVPAGGDIITGAELRQTLEGIGASPAHLEPKYPYWFGLLPTAPKDCVHVHGQAFCKLTAVLVDSDDRLDTKVHSMRAGSIGLFTRSQVAAIANKLARRVIRYPFGTQVAGEPAMDAPPMPGDDRRDPDQRNPTSNHPATEPEPLTAAFAQASFRKREKLHNSPILVEMTVPDAAEIEARKASGFFSEPFRPHKDDLWVAEVAYFVPAPGNRRDTILPKPVAVTGIVLPPREGEKNGNGKTS